jgi:CysZ protein
MLDFLRSISYLFRGAKLLRQPGVRRFIVAPLLVSLLIAIASLTGTSLLIERALDAWTPATWHWLRWVLWPILAVVLFGVMVIVTGLLANIIAAPFNSDLAGKITEILADDRDVPATVRGWSAEALISMGSESQRLIRGLLWLVPLGLLALLPGGALPASVLGWLLGARTLGMQYLDYPMARQGLGFSKQNQVVRQRRWLILGFGIGVTLLHMLPLLNFLAMPIAIAGATALWHDCLRTADGKPPPT